VKKITKQQSQCKKVQVLREVVVFWRQKKVPKKVFKKVVMLRTQGTDTIGQAYHTKSFTLVSTVSNFTQVSFKYTNIAI